MDRVEAITIFDRVNKSKTQLEAWHTIRKELCGGEYNAPQHTHPPAIAELLESCYGELYRDGTGHSKVREFIEYVRQQQADA